MVHIIKQGEYLEDHCGNDYANSLEIFVVFYPEVVHWVNEKEYYYSYVVNYCIDSGLEFIAAWPC